MLTKLKKDTLFKLLNWYLAGRDLGLRTSARLTKRSY
jgi:hypothetical protein